MSSGYPSAEWLLLDHFGAAYGTIAGGDVLMRGLWFSSLVVFPCAAVDAEPERPSTARPWWADPQPG
ncbi:hypothetical protein [Nocardiopsis valliformis]|uniref:hypothetical protein n=1 Tax=Nocardiopsis valliformis TaxID=239974 RepID=UPI0003485139|nr:hypothetical protein [Nocardiopsis valliformis]